MNTDLVDDLLAPDRLAIALRILADRAGRWVILGMSFAMFAATLYRPSWIRVAVATLFTVLIYLPSWIRRDAGPRI